jgi:tetratricopeptide (TPR) repeat protein
MDSLKLSHHRMKLLVAALLILLTIIAFLPLTHNGFINSFDDNAYVTENMFVQGGLSLRGLTYAFTTTQAANWHPLTWLSLMLDYQLFGLNPKGYHATNLFFHLANVLLLFLILENMTKALWPSALTAALFALHPLHVESVAWVSERKDVLSTFFWLTTMGAYLRYVRRPGWGRYSLILLSFFLGLLTKPMLVTLPFALLLLDYWPLGRFQLPPPPAARRGKSGKQPYQRFAPRLVWEKVPLLILSAFFCLSTIHAQQSAMASLEKFPFAARLGNALLSYVSYLGKMIWPVHLAIFYPLFKDSLSWGQVAAAALALLAISLLVLKGARKYPYLPVGWFWYLGTLVPAIGLVQVGIQSMADRYTYVPLIGIFIILAWGLSDLSAKWRGRELWLGAAAGLGLVTLMTLTWYQLGYWRNSKSIFEHAVEVTENNYMAYSILIIEYEKAGQIDKATKMFQKAIEINNFPLAYYNFGELVIRQNNFDEAIPILEKAIQFKKGFALPYNSLGLIYDHKGRYTEALAMYKRAIELDPTYGDAYNNLGIYYAKQGRYGDAIAMFQKAVKFNPTSENYNNLGLALAKQGNLDQAIDMLREAIKIDPDNFGAQNTLKAFQAQREGR